VREQRLKSKRQEAEFSFFEAEIDRLKYELQRKDEEVAELKRIAAKRDGETNDGGVSR
jgi:hypothetical protein